MYRVKFSPKCNWSNILGALTKLFMLGDEITFIWMGECI